MKKLYWGLVILNAISIFLLFWIIGFPERLINTDYTPDKIDRINSFVIDMAIGIITSTLFYILLVYIPQRKKEKIIRRTIQQPLREIANFMQLPIAYTAFSLDISGNDKYYKKLPNNFYSGIPYKIPTYVGMTFFYSIDIITNIKEIELFYRVSLVGLIFERKELFKTIEKIMEMPNIINENDELIELLQNIKNSSFMNTIGIMEGMKNVDKETNLTPFDKLSISEFYKLYCQLLKYVTPHKIIPKRIEHTS